MLNTDNQIPARDLQKSYKKIVERVSTSNQPVILTTNKGPQAAIISLNDLRELERTKAQDVGLEMLKLARENREELRKLPANLRAKADDLLYGEKR